MASLVYDVSTNGSFQIKETANTACPWQLTSGSFNRTFVTKRDIKNGISNPGRFSHFVTQGYMPVSAYVRETDKVDSIQLGILKTTWASTVNGYYWCSTPATVFSQTDFKAFRRCNLANSICYPASHAIWTPLLAQAIAKANAKVRMNAGLAEGFAELRKTQSMFLDTARTIVSSARSVRRGNFLQAAKTLGCNVPNGVKKSKGFDSNWLAYRYGWTPLYSSLLTTLKATYDYYYNHRFIRFAHGYATMETSSSGLDAFTTNTEGYMSTDPCAGDYVGAPFDFSVHKGVKWNLKRSFKHVFRVDVSYIYKVTNPNLSYANDLGLVDPVPLAWELTPLSFVADWFFNIGECLQQIGAFTGKEFLSGSKSFKDSASVVYESVDVLPDSPPSGMQHTFITPAIVNRSAVRFERQILTSQPLFGLHVDNGLNPKRIADAVSLLAQAFRH